MHLLFRRVWVVLFPPTEEHRPEAADRSAYERFAIPFSFKPRLTVWEATLAAVVSFARIVLGSILFAFWGTGILFVWSKITNLLLRIAAVLPLIALFVVALAALMYCISLLIQRLFPRLSRAS